MRYQVDEEDIRLDSYLTKKTSESRSQVVKMIKSDEVLVNGKVTKAGYILKKDDIIEVNHLKKDESILPEEMDLI